ncbi:MAG: hypothetical protein F6K16_25710 [Symploca sp. SIO2B6]|nr:hypothetical protein [Symploca sp. SIO2B6]
MFGIIAKAQAEDRQWEESKITLSTAFEIAEGRYQKWERVNILCKIAEAQAVRDKDTAQATLALAKREGAEYLWKIAEAQAKIGEIPSAFQLLNKIEDKLQLVKALYWIALTQFKKGKKQQLLKTLTAALQAKDKIEDKQKLMQALKAVARMEVMAGKGKEAVKTAEKILTERKLYLPGIASWLVEIGEQENFKQLLIPCAYYLDASYEMCGHLAKLYPAQVTDIAKVVKEFAVSSSKNI